MMDLLTAVTAMTSVACAVTAGVFFAFSSFVMRALSNLSSGNAVAAMQAINSAAIPSSFFFIAYATVLPCLALAGWAMREANDPAAPWLLAGSACYLVGSMAVTAFANLPRNDYLARIDPESEQAAQYWSRYLAEWTFWNHVRAAAALLSAAALTAGLILH